MQLATPALLLDLDVLERNLARMQARADAQGVSLRPHVKTHKCVEIARRQRELGARGITVSTIVEAETFARAGFDDITWAVPNPVAHVARVLELARRMTFRISLDDASAVAIFDVAAQAADLRLHVWLEVDSGGRRSGVDPASPETLPLLDTIIRSAGLELDGILTHAGHAYHARSRDELRAIAEEERDVMVALRARALRDGILVPKISIGSTPTLAVADTEGALAGVDEIRPGNYVFHDQTQVALGAANLEDCALTVLTTVISHQRGAGHFVTDAGSLALSKDLGADHLPGARGLGRIFEDYAARRLDDRVFFSELSQEHGKVTGLSPDALEATYPVGARVRVLEQHACLTAALFDEYHVVRGNALADRWPIERRR